MAFNKNTWTKDYTHAKGLGQLSAEDAIRKGYKPKVKVAKAKKSKD
jgi:hypothetical protein